MNPCCSLIASLNSNAQHITLPKDSRLPLPEPILVTGTQINGFLFFSCRKEAVHESPDPACRSSGGKRRDQVSFPGLRFLVNNP